jgi:hypothetical protein
VDKFFTHEYAKTLHSQQGDRIDSKYVIWDWDHFHASRKWLYTAVTRCVSFSNVAFINKNEVEAIPLSFYKSKISGYKNQDIKAKREIVESKYIDVKTLMSYTMCCRCFVPLDMTNLTANRKDNTLGHTKENCEAMCVSCNCALSNK